MVNYIRLKSLSIHFGGQENTVKEVVYETFTCCAVL